MSKDFMPIDAYHYGKDGKFKERTGELRIDWAESQLKGRPVPQVPAGCTLIAPPPELGKSGDLYFDEGRQSWYVVKAADKNLIITPINENPPLTLEEQAINAREVALKEMEQLATKRLSALDYDPFKSSYRRYLELYARQYLKDYMDGGKADPGWLSIVAAGHRMTVVDYCNKVLKLAHSENAGVFKILALKGKYGRLIRAAAAGPRLEYVLEKMRQELGTVTPTSELNLEDI